MPKFKLSDTQLIILSTAAKADRPTGRRDLKILKAKGAALTRAVNGLLKRGLIKEVRVKPRATFWRKDETDNAMALAITVAGQKAIGIVQARTIRKGATSHVAKGKRRPRPNSKQAKLINMLHGDGITIAALSKTLGWLPHTVRAAFTRLRQKGLAIEHVREDGVSRYHIADDRHAA
jgi:biotin operon repressor